jgi:hypothetical protein
MTKDKEPKAGIILTSRLILGDKEYYLSTVDGDDFSETLIWEKPLPSLVGDLGRLIVHDEGKTGGISTHIAWLKRLNKDGGYIE